MASFFDCGRGRLGSASLQQDVDQRREALDEVMAKLRDLDRQAEGLEQQRRQFEEMEQRVAHLGRW
ncbi:MAG TPA: hypothetical protein VF970_11705 [Gemmatimonadales bacterium]